MVIDVQSLLPVVQEIARAASPGRSLAESVQGLARDALEFLCCPCYRAAGGAEILTG